MPSVGILILLVIGGTWMCVKARAAAPAAVFSALSVLFIVSTPAGAVLPGVLSSLFSAIDSAATPALNNQTATATAVHR